MSVVLTYSKELLKIEQQPQKQVKPISLRDEPVFYRKKKCMTLNHRKMPTFAPNKKNANYPFLNYPISKNSKL